MRCQDYDVITGMITEECCNCGIVFGMPKDFRDVLLKKGDWFYCPSGHRQHYTETTESKLRKQLERTEGRLNQATQQARQAQEQAQRKQRKYARIRDRVKNGVCPCCNRTFQNLQSHMKTQHPDFGQDKQLKTLRLLYGLTQADLAEELGVSTASVSLAERGKPVGDWIQSRVEDWLETA